MECICVLCEQPAMIDATVPLFWMHSSFVAIMYVFCEQPVMIVLVKNVMKCLPKFVMLTHSGNIAKHILEIFHHVIATCTIHCSLTMFLAHLATKNTFQLLLHYNNIQVHGENHGTNKQNLPTYAYNKIQLKLDIFSNLAHLISRNVANLLDHTFYPAIFLYETSTNVWLRSFGCHLPVQIGLGNHCNVLHLLFWNIITMAQNKIQIFIYPVIAVTRSM